MKTESQVDTLMQLIPKPFRSRWCGGERGDCACLGCVQIGNRAVIYQKITGTPFRRDPEYLLEEELQAHEDVYRDNKITKEEWEAWRSRHGEPTPSKSSFCASVLLKEIP